MNVLVLQMNGGPDKAENIAQAETLLAEAAAQGPIDVLALPENWTCLGGGAELKRREAEELPAPGSDATGGPAYEWLRTQARRFGCFVHGGSIVEQSGDRLFNTTLVFDREGREVARYRKIHLFDVTLPDGTRCGESDVVGSGDQVVTFAIDGVTAGCSICYDLRFPELFRALRLAGAEIIFLPAAFTLQTGKDHWEPLLRARAIETQCWIVASAMWGEHRNANGISRTWGHSLVCDPWGHVVAMASDGIGSLRARIDRTITERVRRDFPVMTHLRVPYLGSTEIVTVEACGPMK